MADIAFDVLLETSIYIQPLPIWEDEWAQRTVASAKLLFDAADLNGACNRAYCAMFDAARAALLTVEPPLQSEVIKTHS